MRSRSRLEIVRRGIVARDNLLPVRSELIETAERLGATGFVELARALET